MVCRVLTRRFGPITQILQTPFFSFIFLEFHMSFLEIPIFPHCYGVSYVLEQTGLLIN